MLKITIPFTNQIVLDTATYHENELDQLTINQFDEVRGTLALSVKTLLAQDIAVFMVALDCPESVLINVEINNYARVMSFNLLGMLNIKSAGSEQVEIDLPENTYQSFMVDDHQSRDMVICGETNLFIVCLNAEVIDKLVPVDDRAILQNTSHQVITPDMEKLVDTVLHHTRANSLHRILLVAKVIELLFLDLEHLKSTIRQTIPLIKPADRQKLEAARMLIGENLQAPCSLIELAHKVGLNDFKLKKGFKEIFGNTVFGYLADLRMEQAKKMLASAQYTVSEVAHHVGYKNAHHFTAAFKKKYGHLPSEANRANLRLKTNQ